MTRYQAGFNPYAGAVSLPDSNRMESAKADYVANSVDRVSANQPFARIFDLWSTSLKLAVAEDLDPGDVSLQQSRKFHDNIGALIAGDLPLMSLIAALSVRHLFTYHDRTFEEAIRVLDEPREQVQIANIYAYAGSLRLIELLLRQESAPGPALVRHFQKLAVRSESK